MSNSILINFRRNLIPNQNIQVSGKVFFPFPKIGTEGHVLRYLRERAVVRADFLEPCILQ